MAQARKAATREKIARLDADAWIAAGFDALATGGIDAVRVEPLAKMLAITKGSFYWHFADRRALLDAMLAAWTEGRIAAIREQSAVGGAPDKVLRGLADLYTRHANVRGLSIELAIRALARSDEAAAKAVRAVDRERLRHVGDLFAALGGIMIPLVLERLRYDPAVASGVFVTTVTDVVGFFSFLGIATLWFGLK